MKCRTTLGVALAAALAAGLVACGEASDGESAGTRANAKLDAAMERTQRQLAEAGEKTQQKLAAAGERISPTLDAAGERIAEAGGKVAETVKGTVSRESGAAEATNGERPATTTTLTTGPKTTVSGVPGGTRAALSDAAITASIKTDFLKDPDLSVLKIDVDTRDGVVTLNGLADNEPARKRAGDLAAAIKGVREVRNHLTVKRA